MSNLKNQVSQTLDLNLFLLLLNLIIPASLFLFQQVKVLVQLGLSSGKTLAIRVYSETKKDWLN